LNWNDADDTIACVNSTMPWRARWNLLVVVVDNHSVRDDFERLKAHSANIILHANPTNAVFGVGTNAGIRMSLENYCDPVLMLTNDAAIDIRAMERVIESLDTHSELGIIGPLLWDGKTLLAAGGRDIARYSDTHLHQLHNNGRLQSVDYVPGTVALIRAEV